MVVEIVPGSPPPSGVSFAGLDARNQVEVRGSADRIAVYTGPGLCLASDQPGELQGELDRRGIRPGLEPRAISEFLHHGLVFAPRTVFDGVLDLGVGDRLVVGEGYGYGATCAWPWLGARSRQDEVASTDRLLELLAQAVRRRVGKAPATLLLGPGTTSAALALALREGGIGDARAVTFEPDAGGAGEDAASIAARVGIPHESVVLPTDAARVERIVTRYFEDAPLPCGDPTFIPYLLCLSALEPRPEERILDGSGSDAWMGGMPSAAEARGAAIGDRWLRRARPLRGLVGPESPISAALRSRAEWNLLGGRWLRHVDTRNFHEASADTGAQLQVISDGLRALDDADFRSLIRGRHMEQNAVVMRGRMACAVLGAEPVFPLLDRDLAGYWFHLPEADRFDRATRTDKVLLRRLLRERLDYADRPTRERGLGFDGAGFLTRHRAFVLHEIEACPLWNQRAAALAASLIDRPGALRRTWPSVLALFQLSGWVSRHAPEGVEPCPPNTTDA